MIILLLYVMYTSAAFVFTGKDAGDERRGDGAGTRSHDARRACARERVRRREAGQAEATRLGRCKYFEI